jgi:hypothetical protein
MSKRRRVSQPYVPKELWQYGVVPFCDVPTVGILSQASRELRDACRRDLERRLCVPLAVLRHARVEHREELARIAAIVWLGAPSSWVPTDFTLTGQVLVRLVGCVARANVPLDFCVAVTGSGEATYVSGEIGRQAGPRIRWRVTTLGAERPVVPRPLLFLCGVYADEHDEDGRPLLCIQQAVQQAQTVIGISRFQSDTATWPVYAGQDATALDKIVKLLRQRL